jgi:tRNA(Arg) A34 adenosine deaminase TadA
MRKAIEAARANSRHPFGAILIDRIDGRVVTEGVNKSDICPTLHGEMDAIRQYSRLHADLDASRLCLYTTAEPCCMCQGAILWAGIRGVVFGTSIDTLTTLGWRQIAIPAAEVVQRAAHARCEIIGGILQDECDHLFREAIDKHDRD